MKKLIIVLAAAIAICAMSVSTLAASWDGFIASPSASGAPTIVEKSSDDGSKISSYRDRVENLSPGQIANFEDAYESIVGYESVLKMNSGISDIANNVKVSPSELAVSDLFYITVPEDKEGAVVSLESPTFANFVCLLRYDGSSWVVVEAEKTGDNVIKFNSIPGAYAAIVSTGATPDHSDDSDSSIVPIIIIASVAAAAAIAGTAAFLVYRKKKPVAPIVTPSQPVFNRRKKGRKIKSNTQRNRNRQRKKKRDKKRNGKRKKHG